MTHRERFNKLFCGQPVDRVPFIDFMGGCNFPSCLDRWKREGLASDADWETVRDIIGFDYPRGLYIGAKFLFYPEFDPVFVRKDGDKTFSRNKWGGLEIQKDGSELMPLTLEGAIKDRYAWDMFKKRFVGNFTERLPHDFEIYCQQAADSDIPVYTGDLPAGFFGGLRELMGFETLLYTYYDDPELMHEILDTLCDLWIGIYTEIQKHIHIDFVFVWEDMCSKTGPLISPSLFREFLLPRYRRLTKAVRDNGCAHVMVDSDGDERPLVPLWLEGGVNIVVPWESQFGLDIRDVRRNYPKLGMIGGLDKHVLEFSHEKMDAELEKVPYMLEQGYYIPGIDHGVTNNVPWDNYRYFYDKLRDIIFR